LEFGQDVLNFDLDLTKSPILSHTPIHEKVYSNPVCPRVAWCDP
jgi:hypothetical protein